MIITDKRSKNEPLYNIEIGNCFVYHDSFYMKTDEFDPETEVCVCINLLSGFVIRISKHSVVQKIESVEVILK